MIIDTHRISNRTTSIVLISAFVLATAVLFTIGAVMPAPLVIAWFAEGAFFERASGILWLVAAAVSLLYFNQDRARSVLFAVSFGLLSARENDLHRAFTQDSILKLNYYRNTVGSEKYIAGAVAVVAIAILLTFLYSVFNHFLRRGGYREASTRMMVVALAALAGTKICDRLPSVARHSYQINLSTEDLDILKALEEGVETIVPLFIIIALLTVPNVLTAKRRLSHKPCG